MPSRTRFVGRRTDLLATKIRQLGLDPLPGGVIDNRLMQSFVQFLLLPEFADVDRSPQNVVKSHTREGCATADTPIPIASLFTNEPELV